MCAFDWVGAD